MAESGGTSLSGLPGTNPLGFLAALGAQFALDWRGKSCAMFWTDQPIPQPVLEPAVDLDEIAEAVLFVAARWLDGPALDESVDPKLKLKSQEIREYLEQARVAGTSGLLAACLLAEGSLDRSQIAKPSDFYFTAGQQKFVSIARTNLGEVTKDEIIADLGSRWSYEGARDSLMWDTVDDRDHALSASDPSKSKKPTNPGAEALAVLGLVRFPSFASQGRTRTQGCSGSWKSGAFTWPLWGVPASSRTAGSLLGHVAPEGAERHRLKWYRAWGINRVLQSQIRRSDQGGYGTFGPPRVVWQRE
ncbi:MAG: hypothetical protein F4Y27_08265 [Acidimicrobiaceae bacterium]|nr:hypothetical protein [Acidimicrobiaceae bacterium]MYA74655.1 hypothetical protein [Acidimicrobiaceae bacterium]MYG54734.1 hypothetical protein [Acidimicrobiaceae bacterium]MYJ98806.1 hypothetical protein [Acidimicrobiaceae bacterium]